MTIIILQEYISGGSCAQKFYGQLPVWYQQGIYGYTSQLAQILKSLMGDQVRPINITFLFGAHYGGTNSCRFFSISRIM